MNEQNKKQEETASKALQTDKKAASLIPLDQNGIALRNLDDLLRFAGMAVQAGVAPKGMSSSAAAIAIQAGLERGLGLLGGLQQCVVINGNLSWRGQAAAALIRNSKLCIPGTFEFWAEGEGDKQIGIAEAQRVGDKKVTRREFSVKDARQAKLWAKGGAWQEYPKRMLMWRALGLLARDKFSDVLGGFPIAEEAGDFIDEPRREQPIQTKVEVQPPPSPDPLMQALELEPKEAEVVDAEEATEEEMCEHGNSGECHQCADAEFHKEDIATQASLYE